MLYAEPVKGTRNQIGELSRLICILGIGDSEVLNSKPSLPRHELMQHIYLMEPDCCYGGLNLCKCENNLLELHQESPGSLSETLQRLVKDLLRVAKEAKQKVCV
jgi:hypothetical protein